MIYSNKITEKKLYKDIKFERDIPTLVRTVKGETSGGNTINMRNVTHCILNRVRKQRAEAWGLNIHDVCLKKNSKDEYQFSYWGKTKRKFLSFFYVEDTLIRVLSALKDYKIGVDYVNGATHYHANDILPDWAIGKTPCISDSMHKFYDDIR